MGNTMPKSKQIMPTEEQILIILDDCDISCSYWADSFEMQNGIKYDDFQNPQWEMVVTYNDGVELVTETLTIDKLNANWATFVMYSNSRHFCDLVQDNFDDITIDVAFQIGLFGETIYG
jgi:hypothetical protein